MLPLFPYNGILRPAIMLAATAAAFAILKRMKKSVHYRKLLFAACLAYLLFLIYATFLSRSVAQTYSYRLELMGSARQAFSVTAQKSCEKSAPNFEARERRKKAHGWYSSLSE